MRYYKFIMIIVLVLASYISAGAQCTFRNTAFKSGEFLTYNLYYNWKFVWIKAGTASMYTVQSSYNGQPAYRSSLVTRGNERVDNLFLLRDTLLCYASTNMAPLYFRKGAHEGKRYYVDEVFYSYPNGKCQIKQHQLTSSAENRWESHTYENCVFDMLNIFLRARSFDPANWKKGYRVDFMIASGHETVPAQLKFNSRTAIKADNGVKYRCLHFSYLEKEDGKYKRIVDFYVTDDNNHIPVRLDMFLRFGSAKAFLVGIQGYRNPITSQVK